MPAPLSLIIPAFNRENYVAVAIQSVLGQTRGDFELVVWDDGSTDRTLEVAREAARGDPRVRVLGGEHRGVAAALNAAARELHGTYIGWVDSDDWLAPGALERVARVLDERPNVGMAYTQHFAIDEDGRSLGIGRCCMIPYSKLRLLTDFMTFHFRLMRRDAFDRVGGVDETIPLAEDYDLCLKLSETTEVAHVPEPLYNYRVHRGALSQTERAGQIEASGKAVNRALVRRGLASEIELRIELVGRYGLRRRTRETKIEDAVSQGRPGRKPLVAPRAISARPSASVSLVIATYNREDYVSAAIGSVLNQTYRDFELVVWDDGSTDDTATVAERASGGDPRVRIVRAEHRGFTAALVAALSTTSGRYVGWVDSDDALDPAALARTVAMLDANPTVGMAYTQYLVMDNDGTLGGVGPRSKIPYSKERLLTDFMTFHFRLIRREVFDSAGGIDESMLHAQDYDLCLRLSELTEIRQIPEPLYFHRVHERRVSDEHRLEQIHASAEAIRRAIERRGLAREFELDLEIVGRFELRPKAGVHDQKGAARALVSDGGFTPNWDFMGPVGSSRVRDHGLVSCLCVTRGNHVHLERALACFESQTYPRRELVIVYEELDEAARRLLAKPIESVVLVQVPPSPKQPLGALRNVSLEAARGDFICGWDDDDWYAPRRLELELEALVKSRRDACVLSRWLVFDKLTRRAYVSGKRLWEGSLLCRRDLEVLKEGYPALPRGEDLVLLQRMRKRHRIAMLDRPELYVYTVHGGNTWNRAHFDRILKASTALARSDSERVERIAGLIS